MQMIETQGLQHKVRKGDFYRFSLNNNEDNICYFYITDITKNFIDFKFYHDCGNIKGEYIIEDEYNQLKKTNRRKIRHQGVSGIMIKNEMKLKLSHSTKDLIMFCMDNEINIQPQIINFT